MESILADAPVHVFESPKGGFFISSNCHVVGTNLGQGYNLNL